MCAIGGQHRDDAGKKRMSRPEIAVRRLGREDQRLVIIDHFAPDPDALRAAATAATAFLSIGAE
jgi:hypothetical protein